MSRLLLMFSLVIVCLHSVVQAQIEDDTLWNDGCNSDLIDQIEPASPDLDFAEACRVYRTCIMQDMYANTCELRAAAALLPVCPLEDAACRASASLHGAAAALFIPPWYGQSDSDHELLLTYVPLAMAEVDAGAFEDALAAYQQLEAELTDTERALLFFSQALVYGLLEMPEEALAAYQRAIEINPFQPLVYYARAHEYARLGRDHEAALDAEWLRRYTAEHDQDTELAALVTALAEAYPLDASRLEEWRYYPVLESGSGPGGDWQEDRTQEAPSDVYLIDDPELDAVFLLGFSAEYPVLRLARLSPEAATILDIPADGAERIYRFAWGGPDDGSGRLYLVLRDGVFTGSEYRRPYEVSTTTDFMLAPAAAPDPRDQG